MIEKSGTRALCIVTMNSAAPRSSAPHSSMHYYGHAFHIWSTVGGSAWRTIATIMNHEWRFYACLLYSEIVAWIAGGYKPSARWVWTVNFTVWWHILQLSNDMSYPVLHSALYHNAHPSNYSLWNPGDSIHFGSYGVSFSEIRDLTNAQHQHIFPFAAYNASFIKVRLRWPRGTGRNDTGSCKIQVYPSMNIPELAKRVIEELERYYHSPLHGITSRTYIPGIVQRAFLVKLAPGEDFWEPEIGLGPESWPGPLSVLLFSASWVYLLLQLREAID